MASQPPIPEGFELVEDTPAAAPAPSPSSIPEGFELVEDTPSTRSFGDRVSDSYENARNTGFGGIIARGTQRALGQENVIENEVARRKAYEQLNAADPAIVEGQPLTSLGNVAAEIVGEVGGAIRSMDPTIFLGPRQGSYLYQLAGNAGVAGGTDALSQVLELAEGTRQKFDLGQAVAAAGGTAAFIVGGTALSKALNPIIQQLFPKVELDKVPTPKAIDNVRSPRLTTEEELEYLRLTNEGTAEEIKAFIAGKEGFSVDSKQVDAWVRYRDKQGATTDKVTYRDNNGVNQPVRTDTKPPRGPNGKFLIRPKETPSVEALPYSSKEVSDYVQAETSEWTNAPEFEIVNTVDEIQDVDIRQSILDDMETDPDNRVIGFYGPDGKVRIIANNVRSPEQMQAVLFHEALGHHGLAARYQEGLKNLLADIESSPEFKATVDEWIDRWEPKQRPTDRRTAVEEVLAEMSEDGPIPAPVMDKIKNFTKNTARKAGMKNVDFSEREIRSILGTAHQEVMSGSMEATSGRGIRYIKTPIEAPQQTPSSEVRYMIESPNRVNSINLDRFRASGSIKKVLRETAERLPTRPSKTNRDTITAATDMYNDLTPTEFIEQTSRKGITPEEMTAGRMLVLETAERLAGISKEIRSGRGTDALRTELVKKALVLNQLMSEMSTIARNAGQLLQAFNITLGKARNGGYDLKYMLDEAHLGALSSIDDIDLLAARIADAQNIEQISRAVTDSFKGYPEDYITSVRYSAMLSGIGTQTKAVLGTLSNALLRTTSLITSAGIGEARRAFGGGAVKDAVTFKELRARAYGLTQALIDWQTYNNVVRSYRQGSAVNSPDRLDMEGHVTLPGSMVTEYPRRLLASTDAFFRSFIESAEHYGLATRQALREGLEGNDLAVRVNELVQDPTPEMIKAARREADLQQLLLNEGRLLQVLNTAKAARPNMSYMDRLVRFTAQNVFPFARTLNSSVYQMFRHTPLGFLFKADKEAFMRGGAERDEVLARMLIGTSIFFLANSLYEQGLITGNRDSDSSLASQEEAGGIQPRSILVDGEWRSYDGLDAFAVPFTTWATMKKKYDQGEVELNDTVITMMDVIGNLAAISTDETVLSNLGDLTALLSSDEQYDYRRDRVTTSFASSFVPAIARQYTQYADDTAIRDTRGDTYQETLGNSIASGIPGYSARLPQRYDVYGRPMERETGPVSATIAVGRTPGEETDPVVQEVNRLSKGMSTALVRPISRRLGDTTLAGTDYQDLQRFTGKSIMRELSAIMTDPVWEQMTDDEKREEILFIVKQEHRRARKLMKRELEEDGK